MSRPTVVSNELSMAVLGSEVQQIHLAGAVEEHAQFSGPGIDIGRHL